MMARVREIGCNLRYYENIEGGHGTGADNRQAALFSAIEFGFLRQNLR
jgi:prolyl oligopeptidase